MRKLRNKVIAGSVCAVLLTAPLAMAGTITDMFQGLGGITGVPSSGGRNGLDSIGGLMNSGACGLPGDDSGVMDMAGGAITAIFSGDTATEVTQVLNGLHLVAQQCHQARMRL